MLNKLNIKIFADVSSLEDIEKYNKNPLIKGFTTNPSLLKKGGVSDYEAFSKKALEAAQGKSVSIEVVGDTSEEILSQARAISSWGKNTYVKVPYYKTNGENNLDIIKMLSSEGVKLNVTAIMAIDQVQATFDSADKETPLIISVFAGRVADTLRNPAVIMQKASKIVENHPNIEVLWASCREIYNLVQAEECGTEIITLAPSMLSKLKLADIDLLEYSRETSEMFFKDAQTANFEILTNSSLETK